MLFAAIDIGSNAARLLFANAYDKDGTVKLDKASLIRIPTRLGVDVYNNNSISKEKVKDFLKTMKAFKLLIDVYRPNSYLACATAAMREADNSEEILRKVKKETGLDIRIINGKLEAEIIRNHLPYSKTIRYLYGCGWWEYRIKYRERGYLGEAKII